jgi:hypothetical protein
MSAPPPPSVEDVEALVERCVRLNSMLLELNDADATERYVELRNQTPRALVAALQAHAADVNACTRLLKMPWIAWRPLHDATRWALWETAVATLAKHKAHAPLVRAFVRKDVWTNIAIGLPGRGYGGSFPRDRAMVSAMRDLLGFVLNATDAELAHANVEHNVESVLGMIWIDRPELREIMMRMGAARAALRLDGFWIGTLPHYTQPAALHAMILGQLGHTSYP